MRKVLLPILLAAFVCAASADTITLKSGEKLSGKITAESDATLTITLTAGSVTDERTYKKDEIEKVEREAPDEIAWRDIKNFRLDPMSSYSIEAYERIVFALKKFRTQFPQSPHVAEVDKTLDAVEKEQARVNVGDVKFLGRWLSKEEAEKRGTQIQAQQFLASMRQQAAGGDLVGALNSFDLFEKSYSATRFYPDAVESARQWLATLNGQVANARKSLAFNEQQFQKTLAMTSEPQKSQLIAGKKREDANFAAAVAAAQRSKAKWPPFIPRSAASIAALQNLVGPELQRLTTVPIGKMRESIAQVDQATEAMRANDTNKATTLLKTAQQSWSQNAEAIYWLAHVNDVKPAITPQKIILGESPAPGQIALEPVAAAATAPPSAVSRETPRATPRPTVTPRAAVSAAKTEMPEPEKARPFFMRISGALTLVVIAIVIAVMTEIIGRAQAARSIKELNLEEDK